MSNTFPLQFPIWKRETVVCSCFCSFVYLLGLGGFIYPYLIICLVFIIWETHSYLPACGRVGCMTHKKPLKPQFCCSMTALHLTAFTTGGLPTTRQMAPESPVLSADFYKVAGKHPVWDERKHVTHFLQCLLKQRLCCSARCQAPSDPCDADGCCELLEALRHGWHQVRSTSWSIWEGGRLITASVHITFRFDCCTCRPKLFGIFSTLNFLLVSNLNWKSAPQEKLKVSHAFGIGTRSWHRLWILWRVPKEILDWHTAKVCMDFQSVDIIFAQQESKCHCLESRWWSHCQVIIILALVVFI